MKVTVAGITYKVRWQYGLAGNGVCVRRLTECRISRDGNTAREEDYVGFAECSPTDHFCKETGRKVSMTRALKQATRALGWRDTDRRIVWETYFAR
jgi:hypothetical protein